MEDNKKAAIEKIYRLTKQDAEFNEELRKRLGMTSSANSVVIDDDRLSQIYEYCIEKIIRKQAEEFYSDFPIKSIVGILEEDFIRMESFRRKDNFGDFCLSLYQQIECITNKLCEDSALNDITSNMWGCPAYVKSEKDIPIEISNRINGDYSIANLIFPGLNKKTGNLHSIEKSQSALQTQVAKDKMKIIVYFLGYRATMKSSDYDSYREFTSLLGDIYQCRNMNHRGNTQNDWEIAVYERIYPLKSFYYFKFMGGLAQYVDCIKSGIIYIPEIKKYSDSIGKQKVSTPMPKLLGKIKLKDDGKKRIK